MKRHVVSVGLVVLGLVAIVPATPAFAAENPDVIGQLALLNPGVSRAEIESSLKTYAAEQGMTLDAVAAAALADAKGSAASSNSKAVAKTTGGSATLSSGSSSSGGTANVSLGSARYKGDVFVSPASTLFVQHGHTGIYYSPTVVVEAPGSGKKSRSIGVSTYKVGRGAVKQYVKATTAQRNSAANYAYNKLRNKEYNYNFAFNKSLTASKVNCSQLVWTAYKASVKIDLDSNGGPGVYPYNIKDSSKTVTYKTL